MAADYKNKKRDLSVIDRLALCGVAVMGKDYALDAYKMSHKIKTDNPQSLNVMVSRWLNSDKAIEFLNEVKQLSADTILSNVDESEELNEKQLTRIVERGIVTEKDAKKQADMSLKLMAWKKDAQESKEETEKRSFFIPYTSHCKTCKIMGFFRQMNLDGVITDETFEAIANKGICRELAIARDYQAAARKRYISGKPTSGDRNGVEAIGHIFANLLTWEDVLDIYDYFSRMQSGCNSTAPRWIKNSKV